MKNRMGLPEEYEPVLPGKVKAHLAKKQAQETDEDSLLTETVIAVGKVIAMLQHTHQDIFLLQSDGFDVRNLTPTELRELKSACVNHLSHLIPGIEKEKITE
ncbi:hypothetical protein F4X10_06555 [Candidatus Poribacteria bacterium]|nr:hypothetical protein [Candidatus Poribacteria bacterium]